ncbi:phage tail tube protein [Rhizobium leguminosarum]|uniref:phage tail tube protein n=1 Tax=Rhizobium leguminosarum TaxID=384 RepID=UPI003F9608B9
MEPYMTVAHGSQTQLAFVKEATPGVIPTNPSWQTARYVSEGLTLDKQTISSDEVREDRNRTDVTDVGRQVTGPVNTLFSFFTFDDWLAALLCGSWSGSMLKNSVLVKTLAFEKRFEMGATDVFTRYLGCRMNTLDLQLNAKQNITANWGILGIGSPAPETTPIAGSTYADATTTPIFNAALNVASLSITGLAANPKLQSLSIRVNNNLYAVDVVGQYEVYDFGLGIFDVTGSLTAVFESSDLYQAIIDHSDVGISATLSDGIGNSYEINLPKVKLTNGSPVGPGNGRAVVMEVPFTAIFDPSSAATMTVTRTFGGINPPVIPPALPSLNFSSIDNSQYIGQVI